MADFDFISLYGLIIQTSGILIALVSVIALYRIDQINNYLIGLGKVVFNKRQYYLDSGYKMAAKPEEDSKYWDRLKGAAEIKSVDGVEEIMIRLTDAECKLIKNVEERGDTGFYKKAMPQWIQAKALLASIKDLYIISVFLLLLIILISIIAIIINCLQAVTFFVITGLFILNLFFVGRIIYKSFIVKLSYDKDKAKLCFKLKEKSMELKNLYKKEYKKRMLFG